MFKCGLGWLFWWDSVGVDVSLAVAHASDCVLCRVTVCVDCLKFIESTVNFSIVSLNFESNTEVELSDQSVDRDDLVKYRRYISLAYLKHSVIRTQSLTITNDPYIHTS